MRIYRGRNLRTGRCLETNQPYLITTVTLDRRPLFDDWHIGRMLVTELKNATEKNTPQAKLSQCVPCMGGIQNRMNTMDVGRAP